MQVEKKTMKLLVASLRFAAESAKLRRPRP